MLLERLGIVVHRYPVKGDKIASVLRREPELRAWLAQGWTYRRVARECGVHPWTVKRACQQLDLKAKEFDPNKWLKRKDELLGMLRSGKTRGQIARELGVTRNTIVGACHRLNLGADEIVKAKTLEAVREQMRALSARGLAKRKANGKKNSKKVKSTVAIMTDSDAWRFHMRAKAPPPDSATRCTILELERCRCRYPIDGIDPPPGGFYCGAVTETESSSWCAYHAQFVFVNRYGLSGDATEAAPQRHPGHGVETVHKSSPAAVTARPRSIPKRGSAGYWNPVGQEVA